MRCAELESQQSSTISTRQTFPTSSATFSTLIGYSVKSQLWYPAAMGEKVTIMKLKVDLQCEKCCKRVKKLLCKFPQIRDQVFDEKQNMVTIKVVCCSPEKIRDKLCCKGGGCIKSIEIVEPPKPKPPPSKEPEKPKQPEKPKEPEKPKDPPKPCHLEPVSFGVCCVPCYEGRPCFHRHIGSPNPCPPVPIGVCCVLCYYDGRPGGPCFHGHCGPGPLLPFGACCKQCSEGRPGGPCSHGHGEPPKPGPPKPEPPKPCPRVPTGVCCEQCSEGRPGGPCFHGHGGPPKLRPPIPIGVCCEQCSEGRPGGPCFHGHGEPPPCYDGYYGRPVYDSYGGGRPCYVSRCDQYCSEENASGCTIM